MYYRGRYYDRYRIDLSSRRRVAWTVVSPNSCSSHLWVTPVLGATSWHSVAIVEPGWSPVDSSHSSCWGSRNCCQSRWTGRARHRWRRFLGRYPHESRWCHRRVQRLRRWHSLYRWRLQLGRCLQRRIRLAGIGRRCIQLGIHYHESPGGSLRSLKERCRLVPRSRFRLHWRLC